MHGIASLAIGGCGTYGVNGGHFASVFKMINFIGDVVTVRQASIKIHVY